MLGARDGQGALEIIALGNRKDSKVVGRAIEEIAPPRGTGIGAIVRDEKNEEGRVVRRAVIMPHHDTVIEEDDHVIVFCTSKKLVQKVEKLFQVGFHFL